jgi:hypothetical protein
VAEREAWRLDRVARGTYGLEVAEERAGYDFRRTVERVDARSVPCADADGR